MKQFKVKMDFLNSILKVQEIIPRTDKSNYMKLTFWIAKEMLTRETTQPTG